MKLTSTIIGLTALAASSNAAPTAAGTADLSADKFLVGLNGTSESHSSHFTVTAMALPDDVNIVLIPLQPST